MSRLKGPLQLLNLPLQADLQNVVLLTAAVADLLTCTLELLASLVLGICELSLQQGFNAVSEAGSAVSCQGTVGRQDAGGADRGTATYCMGTPSNVSRHCKWVTLPSCPIWEAGYQACQAQRGATDQQAEAEASGWYCGLVPSNWLARAGMAMSIVATETIPPWLTSCRSCPSSACCERQ